MYLPGALRCKASCNSLVSSQKNRVKGAVEEEGTSQCEGYRDVGGADTSAAKDQYGEFLRWS